MISNIFSITYTFYIRNFILDRHHHRGRQYQHRDYGRQPRKKPKWFEPDDTRDHSFQPQTEEAKARRMASFNEIYEKKWWTGDGKHPPSGDGSTLEATGQYIIYLSSCPYSLNNHIQFRTNLSISLNCEQQPLG